MSINNRLSATLTAANIALIHQKFAEIRALLPAIDQLTDAEIKTLLGIDQTIEFDNIASEAVTQHPEFKPATVDLAEYGRDGTFLADTAPLESDASTTSDLIILIRRYAANDVRRASNDIYQTLSDFAAIGNVAAKGYYDRMTPYHPGRPKKATPKPPTP